MPTAAGILEHIDFSALIRDVGENVPEVWAIQSLRRNAASGCRAEVDRYRRSALEAGLARYENCCLHIQKP